MANLGWNIWRYAVDTTEDILVRILDGAQESLVQWTSQQFLNAANLVASTGLNYLWGTLTRNQMQEQSGFITNTVIPISVATITSDSTDPQDYVSLPTIEQSSTTRPGWYDSDTSEYGVVLPSSGSPGIRQSTANFWIVNNTDESIELSLIRPSEGTAEFSGTVIDIRD